MKGEGASSFGWQTHVHPCEDLFVVCMIENQMLSRTRGKRLLDCVLQHRLSSVKSIVVVLLVSDRFREIEPFKAYLKNVFPYL